MARIRKLTPSVLKRIIAEEKQKISKQNIRHEKKSVNENVIDSVTKLALKEVKILLEAKRLRKKRERLKRIIAKKMK